LLEEALALGDADPTRGGGEGAVAPERQPGHVSRSLEGIMIDEGRSKGGGTAVVTVPLELSVRFLSPISDVEPVAQVTRGGLPVAATEPGGPEKVVRDLNYNNRRGYDQKFLPGIILPTPRIRDGGAARVAPLRADQPDFENGVLKYQHFSVVINRNRRMAFFTATNIDGLTYIPIDRDTGLPDDGPEGENWFNDPRMDPEHYVGQPIYSEISNSMIAATSRRTDPTWGTPNKATQRTQTRSIAPTALPSIGASIRAPSSGRASSATYWSSAHAWIGPGSAFYRPCIR
jgi:endonuclease G